ncbi:MAG: chloramphenicol phosphotransferase [Roseiflexaceae bacterium]
MQQHIPPGQIIVLNGTSSAGKSTLAKALQELLPEPYLHIGIDTVIFALPKRYLNPPLWNEVFRYTWPPDGSPEGLVIDAGPIGHRLINGLHLSVAALARAGNHVIVDHVLLETAWVSECAQLFHDLPALFVGVLCPLEVVEQRERDRRDRTLGQARAQFWRVHAHGSYDLTVDTALHSPEACAEQIRRGLMPGRRSAAFEQLRTQGWGEHRHA